MKSAMLNSLKNGEEQTFLAAYTLPSQKYSTPEKVPYNNNEKVPLVKCLKSPDADEI